VKLGAIYRNEVCLLPRVWNAISPWDRTRGLLGRPPLQADEGMLIDACRMVHTVGMAYRLDLAFLDRGGRVRKVVKALAPARFAGNLAAHATLELAPGTADRLGLSEGDVLQWQEAQP